MTLHPFIALLAMAAAALGAPASAEPAPAAHTGAAADIAAWALQPTTGPQGRILPLAGSWNAGDENYRAFCDHGKSRFPQWDPDYTVGLVKAGHHVLPTCDDPEFCGLGGKMDAPAMQRRLAVYYRPALEYCRANRLPLVFRDWNWWKRFLKYARFTQLPASESPVLVKNGKPIEQVGPFGPVERWRELGRQWMGHDLVKAIQEIYWPYCRPVTGSVVRRSPRPCRHSRGWPRHKSLSDRA